MTSRAAVEIRDHSGTGATGAAAAATAPGRDLPGTSTSELAPIPLVAGTLRGDGDPLSTRLPGGPVRR